MIFAPFTRILPSLDLIFTIPPLLVTTPCCFWILKFRGRLPKCDGHKMLMFKHKQHLVHKQNFMCHFQVCIFNPEQMKSLLWLESWILSVSKLYEIIGTLHMCILLFLIRNKKSMSLKSYKYHTNKKYKNQKNKHQKTSRCFFFSWWTWTTFSFQSKVYSITTDQKPWIKFLAEISNAYNNYAPS